MKPPTKPSPDPNLARQQGEQKSAASRPQPVAGQMQGYGMSEAQIHHNEFVNGAMKFTPFDAAGAQALIKQLGHDGFDADSAAAYGNDFGVTVYFFKDGKAVRSVDVNQLPEAPQ